MSDRSIKHSPDDMRDLRWSPPEKAVARKAFEAALLLELKAVIAETKRLAARIEQPDDLWELERYLAAKRKEIDETFDYRYSVLPLVLGVLIRQGRLGEQDYAGSVKKAGAHPQCRRALSLTRRSLGNSLPVSWTLDLVLCDGVLLSFATQVIGKRTYRHKVDQDRDNVPDDYRARSNQQAVIDPKHLERTHNRSHAGVHTLTGPASQHCQQIWHSGEGSSKACQEANDLRYFTGPEQPLGIDHQVLTSCLRCHAHEDKSEHHWSASTHVPPPIAAKVLG